MRITYSPSGMAAVLDDIITLEIVILRNSQIVDTTMISGHSIDLIGTSITVADGNALIITATDLDFEGHALLINGSTIEIPMTGSRTKVYEFQLAPSGEFEKKANWTLPIALGLGIGTLVLGGIAYRRTRR